jgi:WD40 repeat protein
MNRSISVVLLLFIGITFSLNLSAQQPSPTCAMPSFSTVVNEPNMFNEQQEEWLGEILSSQIEREFHVIADPEQNYLDKLGERLLAQLPPTKVHYKFTIIDFPGNNSFGSAGGYIYLSREIIALAQNEDELAGLLGHEIGHIITHQAAIDMTHDWRMLNMMQVGDRNDILAKWNKWLDNYARLKVDSRESDRREQQEQLIADRIALYAMSRAGYQPSKFVDFFDRLAELKGNKGGFWSDLFGKTGRNNKRLRELFRNSAPIPANCITSVADNANERFPKWQKEVIGSSFKVAKEDIPGVVSKIALKPPLRSDLHTLRFSPDGKYLLAQDENTIFLLSHNPVSNLFQIEAPDSHSAQFSPDSRFVSFYDKELRVEKWDIAKEQRVSVHELAVPGECIQTRLSHSGDVLACLTTGYELRLIDVNANNVLANKKVKEPSKEEREYLAMLNWFSDETYVAFNMSFSPDDRYFIASHEKTAFAFDLQGHVEIGLNNHVKEILVNSFTFLGPNEIAGYKYDNHGRSLVRLQFPSGEKIDSFVTSVEGGLAAPAHGNYLLVMQSDPPVTVWDLKTRQNVVSYRKSGFSIYDDVFAGETASGEVGIYNVSDKKYVGGIDLPDGPLDVAKTSMFSPDGKWLAVSEKTRGAIWKLETGERVLQTRGFEGGFFDKDQLIAKFPKTTRNTQDAIFKLDTSTKTTESMYAISYGDITTTINLSILFNGNELASIFASIIEPHSWQFGEFLVKSRLDNSDQKPGKKAPARFLTEVFDVKTNKKIWERKTESDRPHPFYYAPGKTLTLLLDMPETIKADTKDEPALNARFNALTSDAQKHACLLRVVDPANGKPLGTLLVDTGNGSFRLRSVMTTSDTVVIYDSEKRTSIYSLKSGELKGKLFGRPLSVTRDGKKVLVENGKGKVDLYDTSTLRPIMHFTFTSWVSHAEFSDDGSTIHLLTGDQVVYHLKASAPQQSASVQ